MEIDQYFNPNFNKLMSHYITFFLNLVRILTLLTSIKLNHSLMSFHSYFKNLFLVIFTSLRLNSQNHVNAYKFYCLQHANLNEKDQRMYL